ncbi:MAG: hypothetical protein L3J57_15725, partial [Desulfuromusa sp.]|nr:hypothetical protein [Desulfuromusa sp.]
SEELRGQCKLSPIIKRPLNMKILRTVPNNHGMLVKTMWQSTAMGRRNDLVGSGSQCRQTVTEQLGDDFRDARVLGSGDFVEQLLLQVEGKPPPLKLSLEKIIEHVCAKTGLSLTELISQSRSQQIANARSIICYSAFASGHRGVDIARRLGITGSGVTIASRRGKKLLAEHPELQTMVSCSSS